MWKTIVPLSLGFVLMAGSAYAVCGDVTGEGEVTSADALAVLKRAVGQNQNLTCDCGQTGTCDETNSNDGCEGVDEIQACKNCCEQSNDCDNACDAANAVSCEINGLNETCAEQINEAGCSVVCCPGQ